MNWPPALLCHLCQLLKHQGYPQRLKDCCSVILNIETTWNKAVLLMLLGEVENMKWIMTLPFSTSSHAAQSLHQVMLLSHYIKSCCSVNTSSHAAQSIHQVMLLSQCAIWIWRTWCSYATGAGTQLWAHISQHLYSIWLSNEEEVHQEPQATMSSDAVPCSLRCWSLGTPSFLWKVCDEDSEVDMIAMNSAV